MVKTKADIKWNEETKDLQNEISNKLIDYGLNKFKQVFQRRDEIEEAEHQHTLELVKTPDLFYALKHGMDADNAYKLAQANLINAKTREQRARAEVIERALVVFDPVKLPKKYQKFILQNLLNPNSPQARDPETQEELDKSLIQKSKAEADEATNETEFKKWKYDENKRNKGQI